MKSLLILLLLLSTPASHGKDLGNLGDVYPITEPNFLSFIHARLQKLSDSGQLQQMEDAFKARAAESVKHPQPVAGLTTTQQPRVFYFDPTITLSRDIKGPNGQVLLHKSEQVNPLKTVSFHETWVFFDGDDLTQVNWAKQFIKLHRAQQIKLVLVGGGIKELQKILDTRVYFDQHGWLCHKLNIQHVPTVMTQAGLKLKLREVAV